MHVVVPQQLWIGNARDARDPRLLYENSIAAVVDLALDELPAKLPRDFIYCRFPLVDGGGNDESLLRVAVNTVAQLLREQTPTLVACSAGMSRSPCIVAFALAKQRGESPDAVLESVAANKPHDISLPLWEDVKRACSRVVQGRSVWAEDDHGLLDYI